MKLRTNVALALGLLIVSCSSEQDVHSGTPAPVVESTTIPHVFPEDLREALRLVAGLDQVEVSLRTETMVITYERPSGDVGPEVLLQEWLDLATLAAPYLNGPYKIDLVSLARDEPIGRATFRTSDLAAFLSGEMSLEQLLSRIEVRALP